MLHRARFTLLAFGSATVLVAGLGGAAAAAPSTSLPTSDTGRWIVQLAGPSLAAAQAPADKIDVTAPDSRAHLSRLAEQQAGVADRIEARLDRTVEVERSLRNVLNAIVIEATPEEVAVLADVPGVAAVHPEKGYGLTTDASHDVIGSAAFWDGDTGPDLATRGEGVVVGILDSGINHQHPAFAATASDSYTHTNPYPGYLGLCDPSHPFHQPLCNDKLVGAYSFVSAPAVDDNVGHGTHVASTAAGNPVQMTETYGADSFNLTVQGVAPRANVIAYRVCETTTCFSGDILDGIDQAIADQVDVLNMSISGDDDPWNNVLDLALLEAYGAGVFVATSTGNDGVNGAGTVQHTGPWNASVGATTTGRVFANTVSVLGPTPVPPELVAAPAWPSRGTLHQSDITAEVIYSGEVTSEFYGCGSSFPPNSMDGAIALIPVFGCSAAFKITQAVDAGAVAVILFEDNEFLPGPPRFLPDTELASIPAVRLDLDAGVALRDLATSTSSPVMTRIEADTSRVVDPAEADDLAVFSSLGPSTLDVLGPTFTAPGVNILAAFMPSGGDPEQYFFAHGTSMAAPHVAGAGALLKAVHPTWSPMQILSALAGTADPAVTHPDGTAADPFATGAGRIDLPAAARVGLTTDESYANMVAADPALSGDPRQLNTPYYVTHQCPWFCSFSRTVTNVSDVTTDYQVAVTQPTGTSMSAFPTQFTLVPGASQTVTVNMNVFGVGSGEWVFSELELTTTDSHAGGEPIAGVRYPVALRFTP